MEENFADNLAKRITDTFKDMAKPETVVGRPFKMNEYIVVPAVSISMGFGTGGSNKEGTEKENSAGGGGGLKVEPKAFLVAYGNEVDLLNLGHGTGLEAVFESMPSMINKAGEAIKGLVKEVREGKKEEKEEEEEPKEEK